MLAALACRMRNTDFSMIDFAALGEVTGGCMPKAPPPQSQPQQVMAAPEEDKVNVEVATGAVAAQKIGALTGGAQAGGIQAPRMI